MRATVSIGAFVPKPHTPFQWAAQAAPDVVDNRLRKLREAINSDRSLGRNIGLRYHDGQPSLIEGLLSRGDRRVGAVIEAVWRDGGHFDGWSEYFSFERWEAAAARELAPQGVDLAWFTTRERDGDEVLPWDHLDSGLDRGWLWDDWQDALDSREQDDCRWTPCFDCGVCPQMGTEIQIGPTATEMVAAGRMLPLTPVESRRRRRCATRRWRRPGPTDPTGPAREPGRGGRAPVGADRGEGADAVRQAGPGPVQLAPGRGAGHGVGAAPGRGAGVALARLQPAPPALLARGRARPGRPARPSSSRSG